MKAGPRLRSSSVLQWICHRISCKLFFHTRSRPIFTLAKCVEKKTYKPINRTGSTEKFKGRDQATNLTEFFTASLPPNILEWNKISAKKCQTLC